MRLIVDANIIFAAILRDSTTRRILLTAPIDFLAPEHCFDEIMEHIDEICARNGLSKENNQGTIRILRRHIHIIKWNELRETWNEAEALMSEIDADDAPFVAAALSINCDGIWTEDPHFLEQLAIKIWRTKDLLHFIG